MEGSKDDEAEISEKVGGESVDEDEEDEKDEEVSEGEEGPEKVCEEEQDAGCVNADEKVMTEVVGVDDLLSDDKRTPKDERTTRRHSRRVRNTDEASPVNQLQNLRLRDEDGSDENVTQVQESSAGTRDVSPEVSVERYEAERKR